MGKLPVSATVSAATSDSGSDSNGSTRNDFSEQIQTKSLVEPNVPEAGPLQVVFSVCHFYHTKC